MNFHEANSAFRICAAPAQQCHFVPDFASCVSLLLVSVPENRFSGVQHRVDDDMDTLFGLVHPALSAPETVPPAAASNHSGSTSQHSSNDQNPSTVDLHVAGGTSSSDQDWGLDGVCQWSNMSRIC
jgi:myb proto-oncogene protein